jgi:hypothetical protein
MATMDVSRVTWRKSSYSMGNGGECVEFGAWRRSGHSSQQGNCVEVSMGEAVALARDSKDPDGPVLGFSVDAWAALLNTVKSGRLDLA